MPVDGRLHLGVEILHADRDAGDAGAREGGDSFIVEPARVHLDGELSIVAHAEMAALCGGKLGDVVGGKDIGRAAAPVDVGHRVRFRQMFADRGDLGVQRHEVLGDGVVAMGRLGAAAAIPAQPLAERDVRI